MQVNYYQLGARIREARQEQNLSQAMLAEIVHISVPYLSHIENGSKKVSLEVLVQIAGSLRVSVDQMLTGLSSNLDNTVNGDWDILLADCQERECRIIFETAAALKEALRRRGK